MNSRYGRRRFRSFRRSRRSRFSRGLVKRARGNMKAANQQNDVSNVVINLMHTVYCGCSAAATRVETNVDNGNRVDGTYDIGTAVINIYELLRKSDFFGSYAGMYDQFRINSIKVKVTPVQWSTFDQQQSIMNWISGMKGGNGPVSSTVNIELPPKGTEYIYNEDYDESIAESNKNPQYVYPGVSPSNEDYPDPVGYLNNYVRKPVKVVGNPPADYNTAYANGTVAGDSWGVGRLLSDTLSLLVYNEMETKPINYIVNWRVPEGKIANDAPGYNNNIVNNDGNTNTVYEFDPNGITEANPSGLKFKNGVVPFTFVNGTVSYPSSKVISEIAEGNNPENRYIFPQGLTVMTAWDRTGLSDTQFLDLYDGLAVNDITGDSEEICDDVDNNKRYACVIGDNITTYSSAQSKQLVGGSSFNLIRFLYPSSQQEKSTYYSTTQLRPSLVRDEDCVSHYIFKRFSENIGGQTVVTENNRDMLTNPYESSVVPFKPTFLIGILGSNDVKTEVYSTDANITQTIRATNMLKPVKFNLEFDIGVTFRGLRKTQVV